MSDLRICFVGDSLTNGTGDPDCLGWTGRVCASAYERGYPRASGYAEFARIVEKWSAWRTWFEEVED
jgi:lysophospholipase L1-like esterase